MKSLVKLAIQHKSDKWKIHSYAEHYHSHFQFMRLKKIKLLEIGVGGYDDPLSGGASLRMWKDYFPKGRIFGIDIHEKKNIEEDRIRVFCGHQADENFLKIVVKKVGIPDIIIDDGSHMNMHTLRTFDILFPLLKEGGVYVVEDLQAAYWPSFRGRHFRYKTGNKTIMDLLKERADGLNHQEFVDPVYKSSYFDRNISSLHFYHNLAFIFKGSNSRGSNIVPPRTKSGRIKGGDPRL